MFLPEKEGPGVWWVIHKTAYHQKEFFPQLMNMLREYFFCDNCRNHIIEYLRRNPVPRDPNLWFEWSVNFHNQVNQRTGKPIIPLSKAEKEIRGQDEEDCPHCKLRQNNGYDNGYDNIGAHNYVGGQLVNNYIPPQGGETQRGYNGPHYYYRRSNR